MMLWTDLSQLAGAILLMVGALLPVVNPLGDAPIFLAMTPGCDELTRADLAKRIAVYSFFLLLGAMLLGSFVLLMFGLSIPVVQVAGGAVVCAWNARNVHTAIRMISSAAAKSSVNRSEASRVP